MDLRIIVVTLVIGLSQMSFGQFNGELKPERPVTKYKSGQLYANTEAGLIHYTNGESSFQKFGAGVGVEFVCFNSKRSAASLMPSFAVHSSDASQDDFSIENGNYSFRSKTLTRRAILSTALVYRYRLGRSLTVGLGFQPQFVVGDTKDLLIMGRSSSHNPEIKFRRAESTFVGMIGYNGWTRYSFNLIAQYGASPIIEKDDTQRAHAVRFQIARKLIN